MNRSVESPTSRLVRNVASSWALSVVGALVAFFVTPFLVHTLGPERYGVWTLVFSIVSYMNLLDVGMKQSLARFLSKHYATQDWQGLSEVVSTSTAIYGISGVLVIAAVLAAANFLLGAFKVSPDLLPVMRVTLILIGVNQAFAFFLMTLTAIGPFHRYDVSNAIDMLFQLLGAAATVLVLRLGLGLPSLAGAFLAVNVCRLLVRLVVQRRLVPQIRLRPEHVKRERARELLGYGLISFFIVVSWMVLFNLQNVIIGVLIATTSVTYYNIPGQLIVYLRGIINAVGVPLVPAVSHMEAVGEERRIAPLHLRATGYLYYLTTTVCVGVLLFAGQFVLLWMGPGFDASVTILRVLIVPACIYLPQVVAHSVLLGLSRHVALCHVLLAEAGSAVILSGILAKAIGVVGVAWGTAIPQLLIYSFVYPRVFQRILGDELRHFYCVAGKMIGIAVAFTLPLGLVMKWLNQVEGWPGFFFNVALVSISAGAGFWLVVLDRETRRRYMARARRWDANESPLSTRGHHP